MTVLRVLFLLMTGLFFSSLSSTFPANASSGRSALVVANVTYPDTGAETGSLSADVRALVEELKRGGYSVVTAENAGKLALRAAVDKYLSGLQPEADALVFFTGYGIQVAKKNYLIPVDGLIWTEADVVRDGLSLDELLGQMGQRKPRMSAVVVDGARRNVFERRLRSVPQGLAPVSAPIRSIILYTSPANAVVGDETVRSALVGELTRQAGRGQNAEQIVTATRDSLARRLRDGQQPALFANLGQPPAVAEPVRPPPEPAKPVPAPPVQADREAGRAAPPPPVQPPSAPKVPVPDETVPAVERRRLEALDERIRRDPRDEAAIYERGQIHAQRGNAAAAILDFDRVILLNPGSPEAFNNRCWMRAMADEFGKALADCNEALRLRPAFVDAWDSRGLVHLKSGALRAAIADYDEALKLRPRHSSALYGRGLSRKRLGESAAAERDIAAALAIDPDVAREFAAHGTR